MKVANVKSVKKCSALEGVGEAHSQVPTTTPVCTYLQRRGGGEGRGGGRLTRTANRS